MLKNKPQPAQPVPTEELELKDHEAAGDVPENAHEEGIEVPEEPATSEETEINPDEEAEVEKELKSLTNAKFAAMRKEAAEAKKILAEREKELAEYREKLKTLSEQMPVPDQSYSYAPQRRMIGGVPVPETREEWDALARKDWQLAVDMRSILNAQKLQEETRLAERSLSTLESAKQEVLERHPELNDMNSEKSRIFIEVLRNNPRYVNDPEGPILTMYKMEKELRKAGWTDEQIFGGKGNRIQNDALRASRAALTSGGRMPEKSPRTVTLSKEDLEFCKNHGLDPKLYAKEKLDNEARLKGAQL